MFEWDPARNAVNRRKHGISFEEAIEIFDGPVLSEEDDDIREERRERSSSARMQTPNDGSGSDGRSQEATHETHAPKQRQKCAHPSCGH